MFESVAKPLKCPNVLSTITICEVLNSAPMQFETFHSETILAAASFLTSATFLLGLGKASGEIASRQGHGVGSASTGRCDVGRSGISTLMREWAI